MKNYGFEIFAILCLIVLFAVSVAAVKYVYSPTFSQNNLGAYENVGNTIPISRGGTGATTASAALSALGSSAIYSATTASLGGGLLAALGSCTAVVTTSISGVNTTMSTISEPSSPDSNYGALWNVVSWVSSTNTVSTKLCAIAAVTPATTTVDVRVIQ